MPVFTLTIEFTRRLTDRQIESLRDGVLDALVNEVQTRGLALDDSEALTALISVAPCKKAIHSVTYRFLGK